MHYIEMLVLIVFMATASSATAQKLDEPIRIGVLTDENGVYADSAGLGSVEAARMAVEDAGGSVLGRPVEILDADTQNKPDIASDIARRWFGADHVTAIVDLPFTSVAKAVQDVARQANRTVMITASAASEFTTRWCSPISTHWADDTHALAVGASQAVIKEEAQNWFFITVDGAFGLSLEREASEAIRRRNGHVVGRGRFPIGTTDFTALLLNAQSSGAQMIGLVSAGNDLVNLVNRASEVGLSQGGTPSLAGFLVYIQDVQSIGLQTAQGLIFTSGFYWDQNEPARQFSRRFFARRRMMPSKNHALVYTAVTHYLRSLKRAGTDEAVAANRAMRAAGFDFFGKPATVRHDGRVLYEEALWRVKSPQESTKPWDDYALVRTIPINEAFLPPSRACGG